MSNGKQRIVLNDQKSTKENVNAGFPQSSILGSFLFLIYMNDLSGELFSKAKLFVDDTSLFNVAYEINTLANELSSNLKKVSNWTVAIYMFKVNNRKTRIRCEISSKLTIKTAEVFIVNLEHISHLILVFLLLTLSR